MKTSEIARTLLASPAVVSPSALREQLGSDGYSEALRLGWISPDMEFSGSIRVSSRQDRREAMESAAREAAPSAPTNESMIMGSGLPGRAFFGESAPTVNLVTNSPSATSPSAPAGAAPAPAQAKTGDADVGDQVAVAEGGQTYTAKVAAKNPDGSLKLSFSGQAPGGKDTYKANEVKVTGKVPPKV